MTGRKTTGRASASATTGKAAAGKRVRKTARTATRKASARRPGALKKAAGTTRKAAARPAGAKKPRAGKKVSAARKSQAAKRGALRKALAAHGVEKKAPAVRPPFPAYRGTMPYIFVSYSHPDMKEVFSVIKQLNSSRYRIWYDEGIEPGDEWPEVVGKAILESAQFMVFMSPTAVESRNVRNEINLATSANKNILVIYLKNTGLSEGLLLQIGTVQYFNKFEMVDKEFIDKLKRVLSNELHN